MNRKTFSAAYDAPVLRAARAVRGDVTEVDGDQLVAAARGAPERRSFPTS
ncbi:MAG: hypothetical protein IT293_07460 [Deltaproteobacteria bacterium]|nr:hypothetical protein [Deltaproteobacteria bacterium]